MMPPADQRDLSLPVDTFVRSMAVNRSLDAALFLGAGASITSGVPSASICIWRWKCDIFLSNNPGLSRQFSDASLSSTQEKIQRWLDTQGVYPSAGAPEEYGIYAERCYPLPGDRRQFFQSLIAGKQPHAGYKLLCLLAETGLVKSVWTTNFDGLVGRAAASSKLTVVDVGLDTAARIARPVGRGELLYVALHGDFRYDALKNTPEELRHQDKTLRGALQQRVHDNTFVVIGYSGRDESIMNALRAGLTASNSGRLYWCGFSEADIPTPVQDLLLYARAHHREAYYVPTTGFDDVMIRLASHCLEGDQLVRSQAIVSRMGGNARLESPPFVVEAGRVAGIIKSNAFPVTLPGEIMQFRAKGFDQGGAWRHLRGLVSDTNLVAGLQGGHVLALGSVSEVKSVFGDDLLSEVSLVPIIDKELSYSDGVIVSLIRQALVRSLAITRGLKTDGQSMLWMPDAASQEEVYGERCRVHEAAKVYLRRYAGKNYVVVKPTIKAWRLNGQELSLDADREVRRRLLTRQYNDKFNQALERWRKCLFTGTSSEFGFPPGSDAAFRFIIRSTPTFAKITSPRRQSSIQLPTNAALLIANEGTEFAEPTLLLSNRQGDGYVKDTHPLRGITNYQPYDYGLTLRGLAGEVRLGIVCPATEAGALSAYLMRLHARMPPDSKQEYLLEYPGFVSAFGLPFEVPQPGNPGWIDCPELPAATETKKGALELAQLIRSCINEARASVSPNVIVVFIPDRWKKWERFASDGEFFDLHDFVKAYCVQQGIATQFLRAATLSKRYQCEVMWWLALSFYAKSMRTPWVLDILDNETAFVGLGLSLDPQAPRGQHVLLGCSHIYNSMGLGLNFRLGKIERPIVRGRNPFMSRDDARRMGDSVRQLFYESMQALPKRVVIHKHTPFDGAEREGLLEGLAGIPSVDMVEVSVDKALRYVASNIAPNGNFQGDGYPVKRGTAVVLDSARALLWVHGTTQPLDQRRRYYLGKSRIPAPLMIVRHHGTSTLGTLAREILGLSKMNWNTADMYDKIPATIHSSNEIARIGALLQRFGGGPYDYRLFI